MTDRKTRIIGGVGIASDCPLAGALAERLRAARSELVERWLERIVARVNLDARGQIDTVRLVPSTRAIPAMMSASSVSVVGLAVLLANGGSAVELMPAPAAPMRMQLTALFELAGVELSPAFRVAHLVLKWRGGNMHVSQQTGPAGAAPGGVNFETAQILLDRSGRVAEILLDAPAS